MARAAAAVELPGQHGDASYAALGQSVLPTHTQVATEVAPSRQGCCRIGGFALVMLLATAALVDFAKHCLAGTPARSSDARRRTGLWLGLPDLPTLPHFSGGELQGSVLSKEEPAELQGQSSMLDTPSSPWASLFCFCVMRTQGYELEILEVQLHTTTGIFDCDDQMAFTDTSVALSPTFSTTPIGSLSSAFGGQGPMATSSWVNTETFFRVWQLVRESERYRESDWTIKVDPDTVFMPKLLRHHLAERGFSKGGTKGARIYLVNCPNVDAGFYGSLEVMSQAAVDAYVYTMDSCRSTLDYSGWGEDLFAQRCMDAAGARGVGDFSLILDGNCHGAGMPPRCAPGFPAYHPYKSADAWMDCMGEATSQPTRVLDREPAFLAK